MDESDSELLEQFVCERSDEAFETLVRRHLNLVYSAALRQVHSPQLAEDVAQSVFLDLARSASKLKTDSLLSAWLFQTTRRTAINTWRQESRRQAREQIAVELADMNSSEPEWPQIEPLLDEAMESLNPKDRDALLLRFFENKSLREVGDRFGTSEDAAQKRVSRGVDQLRKFFMRRGVTAGAASIAVLLSANAAKAAPAALVGTISSAAASATAFSHVGIAVKTLVMTTTQKIVIASAAAIAVAAGTYQAFHVSELRNQVRELNQQQKPMQAQIEQLSREREDNTTQLAAAQKQLELAHREAANVPKLRGENSRLTAVVQKNAANGTNNNPYMKMMSDPNFQQIFVNNMKRTIPTTYKAVFKELNLTPEEEQTFVNLLSEDLAKNMNFGLDILKGGNKEELTRLREQSKEKLNDDLRALLGEERFHHYQDWVEARPHHATVDSFKIKLTGENALTAEQGDQLFQVVAEETKRRPTPKAIGISEESIDTQMERQKLISECIQNRAAGILNVAQLEAFKKSESERLEEFKSNLKMQQSLFGGMGLTGK